MAKPEPAKNEKFIVVDWENDNQATCCYTRESVEKQIASLLDDGGDEEEIGVFRVEEIDYTRTTTITLDK